MKEGIFLGIESVIFIGMKGFQIRHFKSQNKTFNEVEYPLISGIDKNVAQFQKLCFFA